MTVINQKVFKKGARAYLNFNDFWLMGEVQINQLYIHAQIYTSVMYTAYLFNPDAQFRWISVK